ncbi:putative secreted effector protein, partial [Blumeria graminis f. sp. tritici 96224]
MRTATLLACVGTSLVSLVSTVQASDYHCTNGAVIPASYIVSALTRAREDANNYQYGFSPNQPGAFYKATPTATSYEQLYWREISV